MASALEGLGEPLLRLRARYTVPGPGKHKREGSFLVFPGQLVWTPDEAGTAAPLELRMAALTESLQKAKGKPMLRIPQGPIGHVFDFATVLDRDAAVEMLTSLVTAIVAKGKGPAAPPGPAAPAHSGPLADLKQKLLAEDRDLQALWTQLVGGGVLSDAEFWRGRQHLLNRRSQAQRAARQKAGLSSAMLMAVQPAKDGSSQAKLTLTPDIIQRIFAERPHIHRAYMAMVPDKLEEKDFWQQYVSYELARHARRKKRWVGGAGGADDEDDSPFAAFEDGALAAADMAARIRGVDPALDLARDAFDDYKRGAAAEGAAPAADTGLGPTRGSADDGFIHDINQHAFVVMRPAAGAPLDTTPPSPREAHPSGLEDLRPPEEPGFEPLHVADQKSLHKPTKAGPQRHTDGAQLGAGAFPDLGSLSLAGVRMDPLAAEKVLRELTWHQGEGGLDGLGDGAGGAAPQSPADVLGPELMAVLRQAALTCNELLRHFWACFPAHSAARQAKAGRIRAALSAQYDTLSALGAAAAGAQRLHISRLLKPIHAALDAALDRFATDQAQRGAAQHDALLAAQRGPR